MHLKMSSGNWQPFCLGLYVLIKTWYHGNCVYEVTFPDLLSASDHSSWIPAPKPIELSRIKLKFELDSPPPWWEMTSH